MICLAAKLGLQKRFYTDFCLTILQKKKKKRWMNN